MSTRHDAGRRGRVDRLTRLVSTAALVAAASAQEGGGRSSAVDVPVLWDAEALADWALPLVGLGEGPGYFEPEVYYAAPVDNLRTYPVYHPDFEPEGYREALVARGPEPLIEVEELETREDWIEAGRRAFEELDTAVTRSSDPVVLEYLTSAEQLEAHRSEHLDVVTKDGILLDYRWVVDRDGELKASLSSCASCHTRLMPDGSLLPGAPSNFDIAYSPAARVLLAGFQPKPPRSRAESFHQSHSVPWLEDDPHARYRDWSDERYSALFDADHGAPPGTTFPRFNGSPLYVARMADLRGIRDRRYLDATAAFKNRGPADVARYGILVEFADSGTFGEHRMETEENVKARVRPPDALMYAMALYLCSLEPAPSPHPFDEAARRGQGLFQAEGCAQCHTPPLYTSNELVAATGFRPPEDAARSGLAVSSRRVGTDPGMALRTRKGTGYYRVPSLRGLWYRGLYEHSGSVASLADWFDPRRLADDYVPTGWRGPGIEARAVPGHLFGLDLDDDEKRDLIAFLLTL